MGKRSLSNAFHREWIDALSSGRKAQIVHPPSLSCTGGRTSCNHARSSDTWTRYIHPHDASTAMSNSNTEGTARETREIVPRRNKLHDITISLMSSDALAPPCIHVVPTRYYRIPAPTLRARTLSCTCSPEAITRARMRPRWERDERPGMSTAHRATTRASSQ